MIIFVCYNYINHQYGWPFCNYESSINFSLDFYPLILDWSQLPASKWAIMYKQIEQTMIDNAVNTYLDIDIDMDIDIEVNLDIDMDRYISLDQHIQ